MIRKIDRSKVSQPQLNETNPDTPMTRFMERLDNSRRILDGFHLFNPDDGRENVYRFRSPRGIVEVQVTTTVTEDEPQGEYRFDIRWSGVDRDGEEYTFDQQYDGQLDDGLDLFPLVFDGLYYSYLPDNDGQSDWCESIEFLHDEDGPHLRVRHDGKDTIVRDGTIVNCFMGWVHDDTLMGILLTTIRDNLDPQLSLPAATVTR